MLLIAVVVDLALGGNGYLIRIGPFRIREILFALCVPWAILRLTSFYPVRIDRKIFTFIIAFVAITTFGAAYGYYRGNNPAEIMGELKPLLYFPMLLFVVIAIRSRADAELMAKLLVVCGIALSVAYLLLLLAAYAGIVSYLDLYKLLGQSDEFIFRQAVDRQLLFIGFFYKGAFYIGVATLFLMFGLFRYGQWIATICVIALAMTLTRSLCVGLACAVLFGLLLMRDWRRSVVALGQLGLMAAIIVVAVRAETELNRREIATLSAPEINAESGAPGASSINRESVAETTPQAKTSAPMVETRPTDSVRTDDIKFVLSELNARSLLIGNGLGAHIGARNRIELNYLEVLYKQGLLGLAFWGFLLGYVGWLYWMAAAGVPQSLPFLLSAIFVYATTTFNTFLTGSIGMGAVFISIGSLHALSNARN